ncbi:MAG TPA: long-chain fatty acid--CoA ligase, partial [Actinomycetota bacterium]|nr:long-chain fatty acid--CoA ligase [Actinomycetota bacterium]
LEKFQERVASHPDKVALRYKSGGSWRDITWGDYDRLVSQAGRGLMPLGLRGGDKMAILSRNRPEWHIADLACLSLGATTVPIYATSSADQVEYVLSHSDSKIAVVEDQEQLDKILARCSGLPALEKVVVLEDGEGAGPGLVAAWSSLLTAGDSVPMELFEAARSDVGPGDLATFVYTSGTTGPPKAVMLTHRNIWWTAEATNKHIPIGSAGEARTLSYLPLSHIAERMVSHLLQIYHGSVTWFAESLETVPEDLKDCKPTYLFAVPRVWEKFHAKFTARLEAADPSHRQVKLVKRALETGRRVVELEQEAVARGGKLRDARIPLGLRLRHAALDKLVLSKVRAAMGLDECYLPVSAAAPLNPDLIWFFHSIGVKISEGYGQSEGAGPTTWNPPDAIRIGTVGTPLPGLELRVAEDGEILARGGNISPGYYKNESATRELIDDEGWMHSGDIGELDANGYLRITDRKKDLIITAGGKNIAPQEIENKIKFHPLVSQVVVIGDRRPFLSALVTLDEEKAPWWAREHGVPQDIPSMASNERVLKEIEAAIDEVNRSMARVESVKKFRVLDRDFLQDRNEITPTMKVRRKQINEAYADIIEEMYSKDAPSAAAAKAPAE